MAATANEAHLSPISFDDLDGWRDDDIAAAFAAFRRGAAVLDRHPPKQRASGIDPSALAECLRQAAALTATPSAGVARAFFEAAFGPAEVTVTTDEGFFTGYYEPEVAGSLTPTPRFTVPLYRTPDDLVEIGPGERLPGLDPALRFARRTAAGLEEHPDRAAIMMGCLAGRGLEVVYLEDPIEAFFIQVQGAARVRLTDGREMRITYAAKTGHPYTPIGRTLIDMGALAKGDVTMQTIRAWLHANPGEAGAVMARNRSYVFFREAPVNDVALGPIAAAKVPLTPARSLAVDRLIHSFHTPIWVETTLPGGRPFRRLTIAQDTGSAIVGPKRGDIFFGSGEEAGAIAGAMRAAGRFVVLKPRVGAS